MSSRRPDLEARYEKILDHDNDAPYGSTDPHEASKINRTIWFGVGGVVVASLVVGAAFVSGLDRPNVNRAAVATESPSASLTPTQTETSASASVSASETSASPSASASSKSPSPSIRESHSPTSIPSPSLSTHKVELPPIATSSAPQETHTTTPPSCAWQESGSIITVADCGDHTAYNDAEKSGAHTLGVGMQFETPCLISGMVEIHYGGGADYIENNGYFAVANNC